MIPTYNERENIQVLFESISEALDDSDFEVLFMDYNIPDGAIDKVESLKDSRR